MVQFRCFDVTEGPENAQIHGAVPWKRSLAFVHAGEASYGFGFNSWAWFAIRDGFPAGSASHELGKRLSACR